MINKIAFLIITFVSLNTFATDYQIDDETWSFDLIAKTCPFALEEAIQELSLPASTSIVYPKTIGYQYFKVQLFKPGSPTPSILEFRYWTKNDEHLVCESISAEDYVY